MFKYKVLTNLCQEFYKAQKSGPKGFGLLFYCMVVIKLFGIPLLFLALGPSLCCLFYSTHLELHDHLITYDFSVSSDQALRL